jgi:hypothetical protein
MQTAFGRFLRLVSGLAALVVCVDSASAADLGLRVSGPAAAGQCSELVLTCENGRAYPICPIAVSVEGEVVTATLGNYPGSYVRLVPMGVGYRYAGRGIWFDGFRNDAVLNLGKKQQLTCSVVRS